MKFTVTIERQSETRYDVKVNEHVVGSTEYLPNPKHEYRDWIDVGSTIRHTTKDTALWAILQRTVRLDIGKVRLPTQTFSL